MEITAIDWITATVAVAGLVLGVVNFVTDLVRRRPRAKTTFRKCYKMCDGDRHECYAIHVVNTGECPIFLAQFGLYVPRARGFIPVAPFGLDGEPVPRRLEPGETVAVEVDDEVWLAKDARHVSRAFVRISTEKEFASAPIKVDFAKLAELAAKHRGDLEHLAHAIDSFEKTMV